MLKIRQRRQTEIFFNYQAVCCRKVTWTGRVAPALQINEALIFNLVYSIAQVIFVAKIRNYTSVDLSVQQG